ncbi:terminase [Nocardiopsis alba]|uniref:terminase n=1 Tax=Nocardiopsis alba TaxID=53437 RepID=UPI003D746460
MLVASPAKAHYNLDVGKTIIQFRDGRPGKIEPVTASSESLEGGRPTFAIFEEPHHWMDAGGGHKVARTVRRNLGKISGGMARAVEVTNAHDPGRNSVAQGSYEKMLAAREERRDDDYLYDCREAPADVDLADEDALRAALVEAYGDSTWVDLDRIIAEIYDTRNPVEESRRFYLNHVVASSDAWVRPDQVDALVSDHVVPDGAMIALGFDGSKSRDASALVAVDIDTGHAWALGVWERPDGPEAANWRVPTDVVDETVRSAFDRYDVVSFFADVAYWQSHVDTWAERYRDTLAVKAGPGHSVAFDMRSRTRDFTRAAEATAAAIEDGTFSVDGSGPYGAALLRHLKNARRRPNAYGVGIGKESRESERKVDAAVTLVIAREARRVAMERGNLENRRPAAPGIVYGF